MLTPEEKVRLRPILVIDPGIQFGRVCVEHTRVPADVVAECVAAGESVDFVADSYQLDRDDVLLCCFWFARECAGGRRKLQRQIIEAWSEWAEEALMIMGGHKPGPLGDPPSLDGVTDGD